MSTVETESKSTSRKAPKAKKAEPSIRLRVFELLKKNPDGLTGAQIKDKLELGGIPSLLKDEGLAATPRIKRATVEGVRGVLYLLTAAGKKAVETGKVDSGAAPSSSGKKWPNGR